MITERVEGVCLMGDRTYDVDAASLAVNAVDVMVELHALWDVPAACRIVSALADYDLFRPQQFGTDQRWRPITVLLMFANVIIGARDESHLRNNLGAVSWSLSPTMSSITIL